MERERISERRVVTLAVSCLALFVLLVGALVAVQTSMATAQKKLAEVILPIEDDVTALQGAIAAALAGEAQAASLSAKSPAQRDEKIAEGLRAALAHLRADIAVLGDPTEEQRAAAIEPACAAFLEADDTHFAWHARSTVLDADFHAAVAAWTTDLREATTVFEAVEGQTKLAYILLLRRLDQPADQRELRTSEVRARDRAARDLLGSFRLYGGLVGRLASVESPDALRSMMANEVAPARARVLAGLDDLSEMTAGDGGLSSRVNDARARFDALNRAVGTLDGEKAWPSILLARFAEEQRSAKVHAERRDAAAHLLDQATLLHEGARAIAERASAEAEATLDRVRVASVIVVALGLAGCAYAVRRFGQGIRNLRANNADLSRLRRALTESNERLEVTVARRTAELRARESSLQLVLDATGEGLAAVDLSGSILAERSKAVTDWFGDAPPGTKLWDLLFPADTRAGMSFALAWEQLVSDVFPFEVAADQMPKVVVRDGRELELSFKPVREEDESLVSVLVAIRDVTATRAAQRSEVLAREVQAVLSNTVADPRGFRRALVELGGLVNKACDAEGGAEMRRALHTLKGNAASFGFSVLTATCDALESASDGREGGLRTAEKEGLRSSWQRLLSGVDEAVGVEALELLDVSRGEWKRLRAALERRAPHAQILQQIALWQDERAARPLRRLARQASQLAQHLGKSLQVVVRDGGVRVDADRFAPIWGALVHAIRNAVDHGVESPDARTTSGKCAQACMELAASEDIRTGMVTITVSDDGAGIDFDALRAVAERRGLRSKTKEDLVEALFEDGVTTRSEATEISGRGVGMSALRHACRALGGDVEITTDWRQGTTVRVWVPRGEAVPLSDGSLTFRRRSGGGITAVDIDPVHLQGGEDALTDAAPPPFYVP